MSYFVKAGETPLPISFHQNAGVQKHFCPQNNLHRKDRPLQNPSGIAPVTGSQVSHLKVCSFSSAVSKLQTLTIFKLFKHSGQNCCLKYPFPSDVMKDSSVSNEGADELANFFSWWTITNKENI